MEIFVAAVILGFIFYLKWKMPTSGDSLPVDDDLGGRITNQPDIAFSVLEDRIKRLSEAIARAEGFYVAGSRPYRNNNPGNLTIDIAGGGVGVGYDGSYVIYASADDGWEDLYQQARLMLTGRSRYYRPEMTIQEMANIYTSTERIAWARNVASFLGVTTSTKIGEI